MQVTYYGHSCFTVTTNNKKLLFDPFITPNELTKGKVDIDSLEADYILISHGHEDHIADAEYLAKKTGAKVITNWEIAGWLGQKGVENIHPMNTGGKWNFGDFTVRCVVAQHSSGLPDGTYGGNPMGFIISNQEGEFYYSGDTALTLDMQLIPNWAKLNFAILPIGDNFTMDAKDAAACSKMIECKEVIGVHYDTFGYIKVDSTTAKSAFEAVGAKLHLLEIGETRNF